MKLKMTHFITFVLVFITIALGGVYGGTPTYRTAFVNTTYEGYLKIDCVDFYEQPAFSHPSLKHLVPKKRQNFKNSTKVKFNGKEGCPSGMVPIASSGGEGPKLPQLVPAQVHCYSVVRTKLGDGKKIFYGTAAIAGLYKPTVQGGGQWSASRFKLWTGSEDIRAGWMVFPDYYHDNDAHLYVSFTSGGTGCFNTDCPGFVQTNERVPLGLIPNMYSEVNGTQYGWNIQIQLDDTDGSWHLFIETEGRASKGEKIGYFPGDVFQQLKTGAAQVEWGGEINDPASADPAPEMGSGQILAENEESAGAFWEIVIIDTTPTYQPASDTEEFQDCPDLYTVVDKGDLGEPPVRVIYYGGRQT